MPELINDNRENWGSRAGFILAAVGSAVGLGNLWGFPYKLYSHGGGAFLIPYFIGMVLIGVPILMLLLSLGHMTQSAAPSAFRGIARRSEFVGWMGIFIACLICTFYAVILAWCIKYFCISIMGICQGGELPWAAGVDAGATAEKYFFADTLNMWGSDHSGPAWQLGNLSWSLAGFLIVTWLLIYLCICRGVTLVGKIVLWTVPLPWLMLMILVIRGLTIEGSAAGLEYYLKPDWSELAKPDTWRYAFSQVFFSMSLCFGIMVAYASFLRRKSDINNNALIIGLGDLATSFIAGIAVFATIGGMAAATNTPVTQAAKGGVSLAFVVFPYALAQLPHSAWFSAIFFFALITLGIDSAFSIVEGIVSAVVDKLKCNRHLTLASFCGAFCIIGLIYCTRGGIIWIDNMDSYINGPMGLMFVALLQCLVLGWGYRIARLRHHANERSDWKAGPWWDWLVRLVIPVLLSALFVWALLDITANQQFISSGNTVHIPHVIWIIMAVLSPILAIFISNLRKDGGNAFVDDHQHMINARKRGSFASVCALIAIALICMAFICTTSAKINYTTTDGLNAAGLAAAKNAWQLLGPAGILALVGLFTGMLGVVSSEANKLRPSVLARTSSAMSISAIGLIVGLAVALWVMHGKLDASQAIESRQAIAATTMSGMSYAIMAITLLVIFGGLMWCFYMAVKASNTDEPDQLPEDPASTEML